MFLDSVRTYCLSKPFATEEFPFDASTLVFKVANKMFAILDIDHFTAVGLKCNPEIAIEYRERYVGVTPGYHMNKKHWNSVSIDRDVPADLFYQMIDDSYDLVCAGLSKKVRDELAMG